MKSMLTLLLLAAPLAAQEINTSQLSENGWFSDDTRADGSGTESAGTNLISELLTDDPEASASGTSAHDADILGQIGFGAAPGTVPAGTHEGAVRLLIDGSGSGKSQISHRKDDGTGHGPGSAFGPGFTAEYSWMGTGTPTVTASLKFGIKTADFGSTGSSSRTGENVWDKVLIYEPGNLNGGTSDGTWQTETIDFTTGVWWFFDRTEGASTIGSPMTLSDMSTSGLVFSGSKTVADVYALITAPGAHITSVQFGIGSGNAGGDVYVNQLETSAYRSGMTTTFGGATLLCDQDATPDVIFGSGNDNGSFTLGRSGSLELGLRPKLRFDEFGSPQNIFNSNGDGTYTFDAGAAVGGAGWVTADTPVWNFEWTVNTDWDGGSGDVLSDYTYELGIDFDAGPAANYLAFDNITPSVLVPFWDHAIGTNATGNGAGTSAGDEPTYLALIGANNVAQNSWNHEFFNDPPFDVFDPDATGRYDVYLAAFSGGEEVCRVEMAVLVECPQEFDQDVTNEAIFGSGNLNGEFTTTRHEGVEIGLRGKVRFNAVDVAENTFNSNGDGTYTHQSGAPGGGAGWVTAMTPRWNFEWSVNTDYDGSTGDHLDDLTYELGLDYDPSNDTDYLIWDPITPNATIPYTVPTSQSFWDHSIGDNSTANGAGAEAPDEPTYLTLIATNNLAQQSWNSEFFNEAPFDTAFPNTPGRYDVYMAAFKGGEEVCRTEIAVLVADGSSMMLEAPVCQTDADCNLPGTQVAFDLYARHLESDVTGWQAFLSFDDSAMTFEPTASSYTDDPFSLHIQSLAGAEVAPGELRLDGSVNFGSGLSTTDDELLATLVFTVAEECTPVSLAFDLTQPFDSELSFSGTPLTTALLDSSPTIPDATAPILGPAPDVTQAADAGVGGGCASAVVTFDTPEATDNCSAVTVECFPPSGSTFPVGTTQVSCVGTDACGNVSVRTFDVTVTATNVVDLSAVLVGVSEPSVDRCIHFVTTDSCAATADHSLTFTGGAFTGSIEIPCGTYTGLCAKDEQHTLWDTVPLVLSGDGTKWEATATLMLEPGDTDNDGDVDINDVTLFLAQYALPASPGGCPWDTVTRDADFSNNGLVFSEDYTLLSGNWLTTSECACTVLATGSRERLAQFTPVRDALTQAADLNRDGWVDVRDVELLEQRHGLSGALSARMHETAGR